MAPPVGEVVAAAIADGSLRIAAGRLQTVEPEPGGLRLRWKRRGGGEEEVVAQRVIDCRGPAGDHAVLADPLVRRLVADGLTRPDPCRLGLETSPTGALAAGDAAQPPLFAVGPVTRGTFWEITSIPDIRAQAETVAVAALATARRRVLARAA
jgi:uncharacterized NAD(P)/FAD-binding protein YdhS